MLFNNYLKSVENNITYNINNCNFLSKYFESNSNINFNLELYDDLDILENIDKIDKTHTKFGFFHLKNKILNPTDDDQKLVFNKNNIVITSNPKVYNFIKLNLEKISSLQHSIIQLFDDDFIKNDNIEKIYFKDYLKNLNNNDIVLNYYNIFNIYYPLYHIFSPIILLIIPFIFKKIFPDFSLKNNIIFMFAGIPNMDMFKITDFKQLITTSLSILFFLYNIYVSFKLSTHTQVINNYIKKTLVNINTIIDCCKQMYEFENIGTKLMVSKFSDNFEIFHKLNNIDLLNNGNMMFLYKQIIYYKEELLPYMKFIGYNDYLVCLNTLILTKKYTLPNYITDKTTKLNIEKMNHPYIKDCVENNITIGHNNNSKNILITGPNASGKSTFLKTILINIIFSQTLSICCASKMSMTPFKNIYSYIKKKDHLGKHSLFENEINNITDYLKRIEDKESSFIVIDEIMSGTNIIESTKIGKSICNKLNSFNNNISIITTHNNELTTPDKNNSSTNYKMKIDNNYTYKLVPGVSNDFLGIEILKKKHKFLV